MLARAKGLNMWIEYYPYDAASTAIGSEQLAPQSLEGALGYKYKDVLYDPTQDKLLTKAEYLKIAKSDLGRIVALFIVPRKARLPERLKVLHMVVKDCNPLEDIKVLEDPENNLRLIMKDGVIYKNTRGLFYEPE